MKPNRLKFEQIHIGEQFQFKSSISRDDAMTFAKLTGDCNPLHVDEAFGKKSRFGQNVVHGMLAASYFSQLVGMHCPGVNCLYLSQTLNFKKALFYGDEIEVRGTVIQKYDSVRIIDLKTEILRKTDVAITGVAKVKVEES